MKILNGPLSAILAFFIAAPIQAEMIPGSQFSHENWLGAAYTDDATGLFSHCGVSANYVGGDALFFSVNRQATVTVGVASPRLSGIPVGETFQVQMAVDQGQRFYGQGGVASDGFAILEIQDFSRALEAFKRGYTLVIEGVGLRGVYNLTGTFRALEMARQCAVRNYNNYSPPGGQYPRASETAVDRTLSFQIATMVVSELGINDFRYLSEEELANYNQVPSAVAWQSETARMVGIVFFVPRNGQDNLASSDASDTLSIAEDCEGDFATSARAMPLDPVGATAREIRFVCQSGGDSLEAFISKFFVGDNVVYNVLVFSGDSTPEANSERPQQSRDATLRAASHLLQ